MVKVLNVLKIIWVVVLVEVVSVLLGVLGGAIQGIFAFRIPWYREVGQWEMVFGAGVAGGMCCVFLGPIVYVLLVRTKKVMQSIVLTYGIAVFGGSIVAAILAVGDSGLGWMSMYVTPFIAIMAALGFSIYGTGKEQEYRHG